MTHRGHPDQGTGGALPPSPKPQGHFTTTSPHPSTSIGEEDIIEILSRFCGDGEDPDDLLETVAMCAKLVANIPQGNAEIFANRAQSILTDYLSNSLAVNMNVADVLRALDIRIFGRKSKASSESNLPPPSPRIDDIKYEVAPPAPENAQVKTERSPTPQARGSEASAPPQPRVSSAYSPATPIAMPGWYMQSPPHHGQLHGPYYPVDTPQPNAPFSVQSTLPTTPPNTAQQTPPAAVPSMATPAQMIQVQHAPLAAHASPLPSNPPIYTQPFQAAPAQQELFSSVSGATARAAGATAAQPLQAAPVQHERPPFAQGGPATRAATAQPFQQEYDKLEPVSYGAAIATAPAAGQHTNLQAALLSPTNQPYWVREEVFCKLVVGEGKVLCMTRVYQRSTRHHGVSVRWIECFVYDMSISGLRQPNGLIPPNWTLAVGDLYIFRTPLPRDRLQLEAQSSNQMQWVWLYKATGWVDVTDKWNSGNLDAGEAIPHPLAQFLYLTRNPSGPMWILADSRRAKSSKKHKAVVIVAPNDAKS